MEEGSLDDDLKITKGDTFPNYLAGHNRKKFTGHPTTNWGHPTNF
jgi:hypothetical protein